MKRAERLLGMAAPLRRDVWRLSVVVAGTLTLLLQVPGPSFGEHDDFIDPDNVDHYVDRFNVETQTSNATIHGIAELNRTKMNATLSGSGDVTVYDYTYGDIGDWENVRGKTFCYDKTWTQLECDKYDLAFNLTNLYGKTVAVWNHVGCHEFGHTAGLGHRTEDNDTNDNSCMRQGGDNQYFDSHDTELIDEDV